MEQAILSRAQKLAIRAVSQEPNLASFYLTGGTALAAYYLKHRLSDDLDFFTFEEPDKIFLHNFTTKLKSVLKVKSVRFARLYDRNQFFFEWKSGKELKIEFTKYPFPQLEPPMIKDGVKVDSLRDTAANKLMAILDRFDPKDFVDLYYLLDKFKLENIRRDAEKKFGVTIEDLFLGGELAKVKRVEALPKMVKKLSIEELKSFFSKKTKELGTKIFE